MKTSNITNNNNNEKVTCSAASVKTIIANPAVQAALRSCIRVPEQVRIKQIRKPFKPEKAPADAPATQKVVGIYGTSIMDADTIDLTLVGIELQEDAINHLYRIVDYTLGLSANMESKKFLGYAATGFRVNVTKIERVDNDETKDTAD